jgi:LA2681-like HEPN
MINLEEINILTDDEKIALIGELFDHAHNEQNLKVIELGFKISELIDIEQLTDKNNITLHYFLANGYSSLREIKHKNTIILWNFKLYELIKEIFHLRKAISNVSFQKVEKQRQCEIYTNLGNSFYTIGRFIEAHEYWNKAIEVLPNFAMAIANKATGLHNYGNYLFDNNHRNILNIFAFHGSNLALTLKEFLQPDAEIQMQNLNLDLKEYVPNEYQINLPDLDTFDLGKNKELVKYRKWCLKNTLFINPLNDLGNYKIASHDSLNLPSLTIKWTKPPVYINLYNQIKQEFGTARFSYFNSLDRNRPHFSDVDINIVETMELAQYSYYLEQVKISFRLSYSILDKIAFLLNDYLELGMKENEISFKSIWYISRYKKELKEFFLNSKNWALKGLYWLSKDLYEKEGDWDDILEPEAKEITKIRNYIEHKGLKVQLEYVTYYDKEEEISYTIERLDFEVKTMKMLKLTRSAIMYLSLAIHQEESNKEISDSIKMPIDYGFVPDRMRI